MAITTRFGGGHFYWIAIRYLDTNLSLNIGYDHCSIRKKANFQHYIGKCPFNPIFTKQVRHGNMLLQEKRKTHAGRLPSIRFP